MALILNSCSGNSDEITSNTLENPAGSQSSKMIGVYVAGSENNQACYWKDNEKIILADGDNTLATKIFVNNNHIYVTSLGSPDGKDYIWVDNVKKKISDYYNLPASSDVYFMNACLSGNDFYVLGLFIIRMNQQLINMRSAIGKWSENFINKSFKHSENYSEKYYR
jgi:hypothetical protein